MQFHHRILKHVQRTWEPNSLIATCIEHRSINGDIDVIAWGIGIKSDWIMQGASNGQTLGFSVPLADAADEP